MCPRAAELRTLRGEQRSNNLRGNTDLPTSTSRDYSPSTGGGGGGGGRGNNNNNAGLDRERKKLYDKCSSIKGTYILFVNLLHK